MMTDLGLRSRVRGGFSAELLACGALTPLSAQPGDEWRSGLGARDQILCSQWLHFLASTEFTPEALSRIEDHQPQARCHSDVAKRCHLRVVSVPFGCRPTIVSLSNRDTTAAECSIMYVMSTCSCYEAFE